MVISIVAAAIYALSGADIWLNRLALNGRASHFVIPNAGLWAVLTKFRDGVCTIPTIFVLVFSLPRLVVV